MPDVLAKLPDGTAGIQWPPSLEAEKLTEWADANLDAVLWLGKQDPSPV